MTELTDKKLNRVFLFGRLLSPLYSLLMTGRSLLYEKGIFRQHRLGVPVISVGNLVLGGTGKTPLVLYIAEYLRRLGKKPAILSRGYKGTAAKPVNVVSDTKNILLDAVEAGDEPRLLAERLPGTPVLTGSKRFISGRFALDSFGADAFVLDDGFQHLALKRDLDLVLFSAGKRLGNGRVLPGGHLREPLAALKRADAFVITGVEKPADDEVKEFVSLLQKLHPAKPVFTASLQPKKFLLRFQQGKEQTISQADAGKISLYGFCGIAGPVSFKKTLATCGLKLTGFREFADHHAYTADNIRALLEEAKDSGAAGLVTTEKDMVKMRSLLPREYPLLVVPVRLDLDEDFDRFLASRLQA